MTTYLTAKPITSALLILAALVVGTVKTKMLLYRWLRGLDGVTHDSN